MITTLLSWKLSFVLLFYNSFAKLNKLFTSVQLVDKVLKKNSHFKYIH